MSPIIGGGMKLTGKGMQKAFGKDNAHINANGKQVEVGADKVELERFGIVIKRTDKYVIKADAKGYLIKISDDGSVVRINDVDNAEIKIPKGQFEAPLSAFLETDDAFKGIVRKRATDIAELNKIQDIDEFCNKSFQIIKEEMGIADSPIKLKITDDGNEYDLVTNTVSINRNWAGGDKAELFGAIAHELNHFLQWKEVIRNLDENSPMCNAVIEQLSSTEVGTANLFK